MRPRFYFGMSAGLIWPFHLGIGHGISDRSKWGWTWTYSFDLGFVTFCLTAFENAPDLLREVK